ncbi:MAG: GDSL-type esterase/lipase family protein, partial [Mobilitalea sp.]
MDSPFPCSIEWEKELKSGLGDYRMQHCFSKPMKLTIPFCSLSLLMSVGAFAAPLEKKSDGQPLRIACVGDSITQGTGAGRGFDYPSQLQDQLGQGWEVGNFGVGGRTLLKKGDHPYWIEKAFQQAQEFKPDAVVIMLGTNDTKPENWIHVSEFVADYTELVKTFRDLPSKPKIYVCRPCPVPGEGNWGINEGNVQIEIKMIDQLAKDLGLDVIDIHASLEKSPELFPDRVHPNNQGATVMAETVYTALTGKNAKDLVRANSYFTDHAILQQGAPHPVWGIAPDGTKITVSFSGQTQTTTAQGGAWSVTLDPLKASTKPQTMTISSGAEKISLQDILVGDVWVAGGQSNMERQLGPRKPQKDIIG